MCILKNYVNQQVKFLPFMVAITVEWRRKWQPTPVLLSGKSHGWRSVIGYSPQGHKESDMTERLHFSSLSLLLNSVKVLYLKKERERERERDIVDLQSYV